MNSSNVKRRVLTALLAACALAATYQVWFGRPGNARPLGNQRILKQSERLYRRITLSREAFRTNLEQIRSPLTNNKAVRGMVTVHMYDDAQDVSVLLEWNAASGELIAVTSNAYIQHGDRLDLLGNLGAAQQTSKWLRDLEIAPTSPLWRLEAEPEHDYRHGLYTARWRAVDREVTMEIQDRTGQLITAKMQRLITRSER
jgi:hypothetical protein